MIERVGPSEAIALSPGKRGPKAQFRFHLPNLPTKKIDRMTLVKAIVHFSAVFTAGFMACMVAAASA